ncbi:MAG: hypothetical protein Q8R87_08885 [Anaerolineaceae bacterium]|nr:hypothetical protein [Anaerolineaceae bacterium]
MKGVTSHSEACDKLITSGFRVGPHKAFQFALIASRINFQIETDISDSIMKELLLLKADNLQASIDKSISSFSTPPRIAVVPYATATIPQLRGDK